MKHVLITGANGQLGQCVQNLEVQQIKLHLKTSKNLDITNEAQIEHLFKNNTFSYVVNCAAYTKVDLAETEKDKAFAVNAIGPELLAKYCKLYNVTLIHISTDFIFDGTKDQPYKENDIPNPISVYGKTKLEGEKRIQKLLPQHFIIRTSWLYSEYGNNFLKTMLRLGAEKKELRIVNDQIGTPTYGGDLAQFIVEIVNSGSKAYGIYHFSNKGKCSWFDFANEIFKQTKSEITLKPIPTSSYPAPAKRPKFSVLDTEKNENFVTITNKWNITLKRVLKKLN